MKKFPETTRDKIEQLFAPQILPYFPYYAEFWEKFIGVRSENRLLPYQLCISAAATNGQQILRYHEEISMRHYSQFCQLAGAHFQLEKATEALRETNEAWRHFLFWEAFDNFYQHLGNARNQMYGLWEAIQNINKSLPRKLREYLESRDKSELWREFYRWEQETITLRNNIVHYSRGGAPYSNRTYWLPLPIQKNVAWSETLAQCKSFQEATKKMKKDLSELESLLNTVQRLMGSELEKSFELLGVKIAHE